MHGYIQLAVTWTCIQSFAAAAHSGKLGRWSAFAILSMWQVVQQRRLVLGAGSDESSLMLHGVQRLRPKAAHYKVLKERVAAGS